MKVSQVLGPRVLGVDPGLNVTGYAVLEVAIGGPKVCEAGVVRGITIHFMPAAGEASMYVLMFLVLMFRPRGLLGERIERFE